MEPTVERQEIINGEIAMCPAPSDEHQFGVGDLFRLLDNHAHANRAGFVLMAPVDVVIRRAPALQVRQPDLAFWSVARVGGNTRADFKSARGGGLAPDLAIELLSPEETRRRLASKLADYASIGVLEVWLVGQQTETVEILRLESGAYVRAGLYGSGDVVRSAVLPDLEIAVDELFQE